MYLNISEQEISKKISNANEKLTLKATEDCIDILQNYDDSIDATEVSLRIKKERKDRQLNKAVNETTEKGENNMYNESINNKQKIKLQNNTAKKLRKTLSRKIDNENLSIKHKEECLKILYDEMEQLIKDKGLFEQRKKNNEKERKELENNILLIENKITQLKKELIIEKNKEKEKMKKILEEDLMKKEKSINKIIADNISLDKTITRINKKILSKKDDISWQKNYIIEKKENIRNHNNTLTKFGLTKKKKPLIIRLLGF